MAAVISAAATVIPVRASQPLNAGPLQHIGESRWGVAGGCGWPGLARGPAEAAMCGEPGQGGMRWAAQSSAIADYKGKQRERESSTRRTPTAREIPNIELIPKQQAKGSHCGNADLPWRSFVKAAAGAEL
ncbi:hypothetical protein NDU88_010526 [Pleurodeles waltl]|uniref:Uncharacterized protein n=1 Tax=Pleurodeles waltl TaxID=8319 RepID=A0AAV7QW56_PLEWA|nr:hypothetical protein NDU88_010526 [Pleurodeles waltl]